MKSNLEILVQNVAKTRTLEDLALGYMRYAVLRLLNCREFKDLEDKNVREGRNFDEMIDELVIKNYECERD